MSGNSGVRPTLHCVDDGVPEESVDLLARACAERDVVFSAVDAGNFLYDPAERPAPGDLLFRPSVTGRAQDVEHFLYDDSLATFYPAPGDIFFANVDPERSFEHAGLPIPRSYPCTTSDGDWLEERVADLGGFPVVVKMPGYEGGAGVLLQETPLGLRSTIEYLLTSGAQPVVSAFVPDATHWRVVVVGAQAVAAYRNEPRPGDFRTFGGDDPADYTERPRADLAALAVSAAQTIRRELSGVDILEHPSGRLYLLEANFPCYFPQAQVVAGIDVAGAMVEHLLAKRP